MDESAVDEAAQPPSRSLWQNRDFMLLWSGQAISTLGSSVSAIVTPLLILALTDSPTSAGIAGALWTLPYLIFSLPVGAMIDRWDRKKVMILCDIARAATLASIPIALAFGVLTLWQMYAASFIEGTLFVFFNIAETAALPRVVTKSQLPPATAQNEATFGLTGIVGPSLGTLLYQSLGRGIPFVMDAASFAVSAASLVLIKTEFQTERPAAMPNLRREVKEGLVWLWRQPLIRFMAFLTGGINFVHAASRLILIVLAKDLGAGETAIGAIFSIGALGAIGGSIVGGWIQRRFTFGQVIIAIVWIYVLLFPLYALAPHVAILGLIAGLLFLCSPVYNVVQFSYRLALIPDALQGRVNSAFRLLAFGFQPLGAALSGLLIERVGASAAVAVFAVWLLAWGIAAAANGHVRNARPIAEV